MGRHAYSTGGLLLSPHTCSQCGCRGCCSPSSHPVPLLLAALLLIGPGSLSCKCLPGKKDAGSLFRFSIQKQVYFETVFLARIIIMMALSQNVVYRRHGLTGLAERGSSGPRWDLPRAHLSPPHGAWCWQRSSRLVPEVGHMRC